MRNEGMMFDTMGNFDLKRITFNHFMESNVFDNVAISVVFDCGEVVQCQVDSNVVATND